MAQEKPFFLPGPDLGIVRTQELLMSPPEPLQLPSALRRPRHGAADRGMFPREVNWDPIEAMHGNGSRVLGERVWRGFFAWWSERDEDGGEMEKA